MLFEPIFQALSACVFVERAFDLDTATLEHLAALYPLPETLQRAVLKRQVEFLAGRVCAQHALARLTGQAGMTIPALEDRSPGWPEAIVGAITHTLGYAAACVAPRSVHSGVGIDCERCMTPAQLALQRHICVANELESLMARYNAWSPSELLTLVFSAKESLYKCLYPKVRVYFGMQAARVVALDVQQGTFVIRLEETIHTTYQVGRCWEGVFGCQGHLVMTAIVAQP